MTTPVIWDGLILQRRQIIQGSCELQEKLKKKVTLPEDSKVICFLFLFQISELRKMSLLNVAFHRKMPPCSDPLSAGK